MKPSELQVNRSVCFIRFGHIFTFIIIVFKNFATRRLFQLDSVYQTSKFINNPRVEIDSSDTKSLNGFNSEREAEIKFCGLVKAKTGKYFVVF